MKVEKRCKSVVVEGILNPKYNIALKPMNSICPMADTFLDWFIQPICQILPPNDDDVSHCVQIIALLVDRFQPSPVLHSRFFVMD